MKSKDFLDQVCSQVRFREVRPQIYRELEAHLDDLVEEGVQNGLPAEEAMDCAVQRMGEPLDLGRQLNQAHRPRTEWSLLLVMALLTGFGLTVLHSIESAGLLRFSLFNRTLLYTAAGFILMIVLWVWDYRRIQHWARPLFWGTLLIFLFVLEFGTEIYGSCCYMQVGPITINYVSLTPFILITAVAALFSSWKWETKNLGEAFLMLLSPMALYLASPSIASVLLYGISFLVLMWFSGAQWKQVLGMAFVFILSGILAVVSAPYRMMRFLGFLNSGADPQGAGYIYVQLQNVLREIGFWGHGAGFPAGLIPEIHTDFVFVYLVYTFGWIAGIFLAALALLLILRLFKASRQIKDSFGSLLAMGAVSLFLIQFAWNILMTLGLVPIMGVAMPFISYGGTLYIAQMFLIGLVLSAYRRRDVESTRNVYIDEEKLIKI